MLFIENCGYGQIIRIVLHMINLSKKALPTFIPE